ncbi:MAG: TolC family protein, partial [Syntrophales bacterium LBB04]|nr:TolC family protein [Syntrophales bacterium LBB04]
MNTFKKRCQTLFIGIIVLITMVPMCREEAYAGETAVQVTLEQALEHFYKNNYDILINKYEIDKASMDLMGAKLLPNPNLSVGYTGLESNRKLSTGDNSQSTYRIDQLIELAGKRSLRTNAAQETLEAKRLSHQDLIRSILVGFYSLYFGLNLDSLSLSLNQDTLQQFDRSLDIAEKRYAAGFLSLVDFTKLKVARIDLENNLLNAERQLEIDTSQLQLLLGIDKPVRPMAGQIQTSFPQYSEEDLLAKAYQNRKDLLALQRQLKSAEYVVSLAKAYRIPDITVGAEYERFGQDNVGGVGIGVGVPIPIF